ncbi:hypothetical protein CJJ09_000025 [Candidozyma auris]|nr:hypothetical protein CJJ09_000025 [[Candida] auris]
MVHQLGQDERDRQKNRGGQQKAQTRKEEKEAEANEKFEKLDEESKTFGWGKATRRNVKRQEHLLNEAAETIQASEQSAYDAAEDHDIEDLLED